MYTTFPLHDMGCDIFARQYARHWKCTLSGATSFFHHTPFSLKHTTILYLFIILSLQRECQEMCSTLVETHLIRSVQYTFIPNSM